MEQESYHEDLTDYEKLAVSLYRDADWLFQRRQVPSMYEKIGEDQRYSELTLTEAELSRASMMLMSHAIDTPDSLEITISGRNPYIHQQAYRAFLLILTKREDIKHLYTVDIDRTRLDSVHAYKDVQRTAKPAEIRENGTLPLPYELPETYFSKKPLDQNELQALRNLIQMS